MQRKQIKEFKKYQDELLLTEEEILLRAFDRKMLEEHKKIRDGIRKSREIKAKNKLLLKHQLELVDEELTKIYGWSGSESHSFSFHFHGSTYQSRRCQFLLLQRKKLNKKIEQENLIAEKKKLEELWANNNKFLNAILEFLKRKIAPGARGVFEVGKKVIDMLDDILNAIKRSLPFADNVVQVVIGAVSGLVHMIESIKAWFKFFSTLKKSPDQKIGFKTRLVTEFIKGTIGLAGIGVGAALIAGSLGAAVLGIGFMPAILPIMLFGIYSLSLYNRSYIFHQTKLKLADAEKAVENEYGNLLAKQENKNKIIKEIAKLQLMDSHPNQLAIKFKELDDASKDVNDSTIKLSDLNAKRDELSSKCLTAERKVAYASIEVATSIVVIVGTILGVAAIMGAATVATFGILPTAIILTGVAIAAGVKLFEFIDERTDFKLSNGIRNFFSKLFSKPKQETELSSVDVKAKKGSALLSTVFMQKKLQESTLASSTADLSTTTSARATASAATATPPILIPRKTTTKSNNEVAQSLTLKSPSGSIMRSSFHAHSVLEDTKTLHAFSPKPSGIKAQ